MSVEIADMENPDYGVGCKTNSRSSGPPIVCEADLAISTTFFSTFPKPVYVVELNATNSQDAAGEIFVILGKFILELSNPSLPEHVLGWEINLRIF